MNKGYYIVIEGPEGAGKTTQVELLAHVLAKYNYPVKIFREPDSQNHVSARAIRRLTQDPQYPLNTRSEVLLYNAARALSLEVIKKAKQNGMICLVDRNYLTTLAVQYYGRGDIKDYKTINDIIDFAIGDMDPDLTIVLDASVDELSERLQNRGAGERFDNLDHAFLDRVRAGYLLEAKTRGYPVVYAGGKKEDVFANIWHYVAECIAGKINTNKYNRIQPISVQLSPEAQTLIIDENGFNITEDGLKELQNYITNTSGNVYAFNGNLDSVTVAAAMARLSRRGDDMRVTLLDEFISNKGKDEDLIKRVVTAYGDDSVQQLVGIHLVVEDASNILTKKLEWGRLAAYLEQSTRYIYYDTKDSNGNYKFYIPKSLKGKNKKLYVNTMNKMFENYSVVVRQLTEYLTKNDKTPKKQQDVAWRSAIRAQACDAARPMLPVSAKSTVGLYGSAQAIESLIMHLLSDEMTEARECGQKILNESRKIIPAFLERADKADRGGATIAYRAETRNELRKLSDKYLKNSYGTVSNAVELTEFYPKNELDIVPHMLYEFSDLSENDLKNTLFSMSLNEKQAIFKAYVGERLNRRHKPGRALERATYSWDIVCDYGIFRDLQRHRMVNDLSWQQLTPRYGYDMPEVIELAGLDDIYTNNFDLSIELHSKLQDLNLDAQYATLLGHKMRWKITMNARELMHFIELRSSPQGHPGYRAIVKKMYDILSEHHPLMAESLKFVNKDEDPALARLAAEKYTQYKLSILDNS
jgi:dTMP kinase